MNKKQSYEQRLEEAAQKWCVENQFDDNKDRGVSFKDGAKHVLANPPDDWVRKEDMDMAMNAMGFVLGLARKMDDSFMIFGDTFAHNLKFMDEQYSALFDKFYPTKKEES